MHPVSCPVLQLLLEGDTPECPKLSHKAKTGVTESSGTIRIDTTPGWVQFLQADLFQLSGFPWDLWAPPGYFPPAPNPEIKWPS